MTNYMLRPRLKLFFEIFLCDKYSTKWKEDDLWLSSMIPAASLALQHNVFESVITNTKANEAWRIVKIT
jgi:hypothetical protein